jgi:hypothetical protein
MTNLIKTIEIATAQIEAGLGDAEFLNRQIDRARRQLRKHGIFAIWWTGSFGPLRWETTDWAAFCPNFGTPLTTVTTPTAFTVSTAD